MPRTAPNPRQRSLWDSPAAWAAKVAEVTTPEPSEQMQQLERVRGEIGRHVLAFCRERFAGSKEFCASELREYVASRVPCAPGSPDRILRDLKKEGVVFYKVVCRRASRYVIVGVLDTPNRGPTGRPESENSCGLREPSSAR